MLQTIIMTGAELDASLSQKLRVLWSSNTLPPEKVYISPDSHAIYIIILDEDEHILGALLMLHLATKRIRYATVHDVLVSENARGLGVGTKLMEAAITLSQKEELEYLELTCRPSRGAATHLYQKMGFELLAQAKDSLEGRNYYRYFLSQH